MKTKVLLVVIFQLLVINIYSQNLEETLRGYRTNFKLFSDSINLEASDQIIIQRAEKKYGSNASFGTGWGYGYQSYHIEFISNETFVEKIFKYRAGRDNNDKLEFIFYDSNNLILASYTSDYSIVDMLCDTSSDKSKYYYSIDLIDIPVVLLGNTVKINMIKRVADKNM